MTETIRKCDACKPKDRVPGALEFSYFIDRTMDGAGSMENNYGSIDLLPRSRD